MAANTMATIEPRLMHLLNVNDSRDHLPSIHSTLGAPNSSEDDADLLLPPLELNAPESTSPGPALLGGSKHLQPQIQQTSPASVSLSASALAAGGDDSSLPGSVVGSGWPIRSLRMVLGEATSGSTSTDSAALPGGPEDPSSAASASVIGKRPRVLPLTDELIQLPQPLKKQKSSQQVGSLSQVFPPIINGLHEPPPNAAVFPPIASAEFDDEDALKRGSSTADFGNNAGSGSTGVAGGITSGAGGVGGTYLFDGVLAGVATISTSEVERISETPSASILPLGGKRTTPEPLPVLSASGKGLKKPSVPAKATKLKTPETPDRAESIDAPTVPGSSKPKRRATKPRRRWTEEETNQLLIGVSRHGLGKWTAILEDPEFSFSSRTAGDLKDRFRTCCPDELRGKFSNADQSTTNPPDGATSSTSTMGMRRLKPKTSLSLEDILIESDEQSEQHSQGQDAAAAIASASSEQPKQRKRRVHRRNMEDMVRLGIQGPFKKSHRRERRPFTEQDDKEILEGLQIYGPAWTKIHRHHRFNLSSRQPTDLRDRVRNKYPEIYANIEKGVFQPQSDTSRRNSSSTAGAGGSAGPEGVMNMTNALLEPSVGTTIEASLAPAAVSGSGVPESTHSHSAISPLTARPPPLRHRKSQENISRRPHHAALPLRVEPLEPQDPSVFDLGESSTSSFLSNVGEMGISRLLLDDPQMPPYTL